MAKNNILFLKDSRKFKQDDPLGSKPGPLINSMDSYAPNISLNVRIAHELGIGGAFFLSRLEDIMLGWADVEKEDGSLWVTRSIEEWTVELCDLWSNRTIQRILKELVDMGIVVAENLNKNKRDKTLSYTINWNSPTYIRLTERRV